MNIELYIDGKLCDLEKSDLSIKLKRQLFNPTQLNSKDAQKSYAITLPSSPVNDEIFQYKNVEETDSKFSLYPDAKLYVNGILILDGKFRLSEITRHSYNGNLGVPAPLTTKDVFGERKMTDAGVWHIEYDTEKGISPYNNGEYKKKYDENPPAIFPLALYRLLQKNEGTKINGEVIDSNTYFESKDFPPSVNCMKMLKHCFDHYGYTLVGSALEDNLLKNIYVSYKNSNDYVQSHPIAKVSFGGVWRNWRDKIEPKVVMNIHSHNSGFNLASCSLLDSEMIRLKEKIVDESKLLDKKGNNISYKVPRDGLYKIEMNATINLLNTAAKNLREKFSNLSRDEMILCDATLEGHNSYRDYRSFFNMACELQLVRSADKEYELSKAQMSNKFFKNNINQSSKEAAIFPQTGCVNFIDPSNNADFICGFSWGRVSYYNYKWGAGDYNENHPVHFFKNYNTTAQENAFPMAIKHGDSWTKGDKKMYAAAPSPGYKKYGGTNPSPVPFKVDLNYATATANIKRNLYNQHNNNPDAQNLNNGTGKIQMVVFLKAGEYIHLLANQDMAFTNHWINQEIDFDLTITPFTTNIKWLQMDDKTGYGTGHMNWNDQTDEYKLMDLVPFFPKEVKIDEWIENFCKAFNLNLIHKGNNNFELNIKEGGFDKQSSIVIDLDKKANVNQAVNQTLALPRSYELGFKIDSSEEGYFKSITNDAPEGNTGGGTFETGSVENNVIKQNSNFSYCWYKKLDVENSEKSPIEVPIITDKEIWDFRNQEDNRFDQEYFDKEQRFWFYTGNYIKLPFGKSGNISEVDSAIVSNEYEKDGKKLILNYEDKPNSIMRNYFTLLTNQKNYTIVECYLTPDEYNDLDKAYIRFNSDLYSVAEADGYDPMGRNKTKLKLIKKI